MSGRRSTHSLASGGCEPWMSLWGGGRNAPLPGTSRRAILSPNKLESAVDLGKLPSNAFADMIQNSLSSKESTMSYFPGMQKGNLDSVKTDEHGKIKKETVSLQGVSVTRVTFDVGAKWS